MHDYVSLNELIMENRDTFLKEHIFEQIIFDIRFCLQNILFHIPPSGSDSPEYSTQFKVYSDNIPPSSAEQENNFTSRETDKQCCNQTSSVKQHNVLIYLRYTLFNILI